MRTTVQQQSFQSKEVTVFHTLEEGESWADFEMEQPTEQFAHRQDWPPSCPLCAHLRTILQRGADTLHPKGP